MYFSLYPKNFEAFVTVPNAFAPHELDILEDMIRTQTLTTGVVGNNETNKSIRDSRIRWISPQEMSWVFERISTIIKEVNDKYFGIDLNHTESVQLTEYDSEYHGFYGYHADSRYGATGDSRFRKLSVSMQLTDPSLYEGGELLLYPDSFDRPEMADRTRGSMTLFRSHILHQVKPVTKGTRYSFVTWCHGPLWK